MYAVGVMAFVLFLSTLVGLPVLPQLSEDLGAGPSDIPIVVSAALATVVILQFFVGILADRFSKRRLILIGALMGSVTSFLCAVATDWTQLVVLRILGGAADAIAMPALLATTAVLGKEQPGKFFGILRSSQGLSFVVGPALGSAFSFISLRAPFVVDGVLSLFAFVVGLLLLKDTERVKSEHALSLFRGLRSTFRTPGVLSYLLMGASGIFAFGILYAFVPTKSQLIGLRAWQIGSILAGGALIFSLVSYLAGALSDRFGRRAFVIVAEALILLAGIGLMLSDCFVSLFVFYCLFCVGETIVYLLCFVYAAETFESRYVGTAMGAFDAVLDLSLLVGPLIAISVHKSTGQLPPIFLIAAVPAAVGLFVLPFRMRRSTGPNR